MVVEFSESLFGVNSESLLGVYQKLSLLSERASSFSESFASSRLRDGEVRTFLSIELRDKVLKLVSFIEVMCLIS